MAFLKEIHVQTLYSHCTNMYVRNNIHIFDVSVHTCLDLVHSMYVPGTYIECTSSCLYVNRKQKQKVAANGIRTQDLEPNIEMP